MKPTSGSVRFPILGFRINETLDELSELARHRCNAHDFMLHGYMFVIQPRGLDTCACGDIGRSRYTTHVVLNLILLISRDAIHFGCCRYTHRSVVLL